MNSSYGLLMSFPDQSETFVLGFEAGQCWQRLEAGNADDVTMHAANQEAFRRIARNYSYDVEFEPAGDGWSVAHFSRGRPKLRAVKDPTVVGTKPNSASESPIILAEQDQSR